MPAERNRRPCSVSGTGTRLLRVLYCTQAGGVLRPHQENVGKAGRQADRQLNGDEAANMCVYVSTGRPAGCVLLCSVKASMRGAAQDLQTRTTCLFATHMHLTLTPLLLLSPFTSPPTPQASPPHRSEPGVVPHKACSQGRSGAMVQHTWPSSTHLVPQVLQAVLALNLDRKAGSGCCFYSSGVDTVVLGLRNKEVEGMSNVRVMCNSTQSV